MANEDIDAATNSFELQKVQARDYRAAQEFYESRAQESLQVQKDMLAAMQAHTQVVTEQAALLDSPDVELWKQLYADNLKIRLGPQVITSNVTDAVMQDMIRDAVMMTNFAFPLVKQAFAALPSQ